ncbi:ATP-dependent translocase ABCB1 [Aplysia californica]|uniref:ATP-dependent translocase ABCB1 n=1 Tax=Aplysia californica TaxID=6500 RepID=A0ABM1A709_APLCA|nr:ATP-dependent translocase ABCB1 [Aplysia californica]
MTKKKHQNEVSLTNIKRLNTQVDADPGGVDIMMNGGKHTNGTSTATGHGKPDAPFQNGKGTAQNGIAEPKPGSQQLEITRNGKGTEGCDFCDEISVGSGKDGGVEKSEVDRTVGPLELFKFATPLAKLLMFIGTIGALMLGVAPPYNISLFGDVIDVFLLNSLQNKTNSTTTDGLKEEVIPIIYQFIGIAFGAFLGGFLAVSCWQWAAEIQVSEMRKTFFRAVMRQDMSWFDVNESGEISSRFSEDMSKISEGIGDKLAIFVQWTTTWISAYIMAFVSDWRLTLAVIVFSPIIILVGSILVKVLRNLAAKEFRAYAKAGAVAEQCLRAIRTVQAFHGQEKEIARYERCLGDAVKVASKKGLAVGLGQSALFFTLYVNLAVAMWVGTVLIQEENLSPGRILPVFLGMVIGSVAMGNALNNLESFANARGAAGKVFDIMARQPMIDIGSQKGLKPQTLQGHVRFHNVKFAYPARPDSVVLAGLNLEVRPGQNVALVGPSGCGKSTTVQLIQRFYDVLDGQVTIDGHNIKDINLAWLRGQIGVVSQEPVLFDATIGENIRFGHLSATQKEIEQAAIDANVHDFISTLPEGYDTRIGERGAQLSGGQKQRIAIARALLRNPKILLMDEATSALDHESEAVVQSALDKAGIGRTTITIAHRLSTVRNADKIVAFSEGEAIEEGTHDQLMARQGLYYQLVQIQANIEKESNLDIADVEIVEEDDWEEDIIDGKLVRASFKRMSSSSKGLQKQVSLVARDSKRKAKADISSPGKPGSQKEEPEAEPVTIAQVFHYNSTEWHLILIGSFSSLVTGAVHPCFSFVISEFIKTFSVEDETEQMNHVHILGASIIGIAIISAISRMFQGYSFSKSGAILTARLRRLTFASIVNQDMEFFDQPHNQVGAIASKLSADASMVQGATGSKIGQVLEAISVLGCSLTIAFVFGWKLALVVVSFLPLMIISGLVQGRAIAGAAKKDRSQLQQAGKLCSEVVDNVRTVASINREEYFVDKFCELIDQTIASNKKMSIIYGITYGVANCLVFFAYAAAFYYGSTLVENGEIEFYNVFRVFGAIVFGGAMVGRQSSFSIDYTKAKLAAARILQLIHRVPKVDVRESQGVKLDLFRGRVCLDKAVYHYSTRPNIPVLNGMDLTINPGETVALVGSSGCGKSTTTQLIERFYDVDSGCLLVDGVDIRKINLQWYRKQLGIVSQEPTLFDSSIAENIAYGDNSRDVSMDEIIQAARQANIHTFVSSLPQGYQTNVGDKGTQLSGGQKQRIAIARALVRNPKILLLDEATSALDTESEKVVQEALDRASQHRTCIVIAHRLSTIQNADKIAVVSKGKVIEQGTHAQLMTIKGAYYRLQKVQNKSQEE